MPGVRIFGLTDDDVPDDTSAPDNVQLGGCYMEFPYGNFAFQHLASLGCGGFAKVSLAQLDRHPHLGIVALKMALPGVPSTTLKHQAAVQQLLSAHPNILQLIDTGENCYLTSLPYLTCLLVSHGQEVLLSCAMHAWLSLHFSKACP